jgi:hypothetical protein
VPRDTRRLENPTVEYRGFSILKIAPNWVRGVRLHPVEIC